MPDEKGQEFLGFTGCHTLWRDGVGEGDDVSSVGRILLRCLWRPMSLGSFRWGQLPGFGAQARWK